MAGIYLHIPFCKSKCPYCNFFSVASLKTRDVFMEALYREIDIQKDYLGEQKVKTIYFGGGTPSFLEPSHISGILEKITSVFSFEQNAEITMEANPDDITIKNLSELRKSGINRLSIGIQSFEADDLKYLGRIHTGEQAEKSVQLAREAGFSNLSLDFIYGMPTLSDDAFRNNLEKAMALHIPHISAYALTIEPKTAMEVMIRKKQTSGPDEDKSVSQFRFLMQYLGSNNYEHYEISNFCLPGMHSVHNSSYWSGDHYLGLGPSAHSYNGTTRHWSVSSISRYVMLIQSGRPHFETELLSPSQKYNEYIMTSLRTIRGTRPDHIRNVFGEKAASHFMAHAHQYLENSYILEHNGIFTLSDKGKLFADRISSDLFLDTD
jgi:oxygen-independent coproporphyrinogen-3 oxidase